MYFNGHSWPHSTAARQASTSAQNLSGGNGQHGGGRMGHVLVAARAVFLLKNGRKNSRGNSRKNTVVGEVVGIIFFTSCVFWGDIVRFW